MSTVSIIGAGGMAVVLGGLAAKAGHTGRGNESGRRQGAQACRLSLGVLDHAVKHTNFSIGNRFPG